MSIFGATFFIGDLFYSTKVTTVICLSCIWIAVLDTNIADCKMLIDESLTKTETLHQIKHSRVVSRAIHERYFNLGMIFF